MSESIICSMLTLGGTIIGFVVAYVIEHYKQKEEMKRVLLDKKIDTYAMAINYISLCSKMGMYKNCIDGEFRKEYEMTVKKADELYDKFYPLFTIIVPKEKTEAYNNLRNNACEKKISHEEAFKKCIELLDFNVNDK